MSAILPSRIPISTVSLPEERVLAFVIRINRQCVRDWASPGGYADLLAATFFLHFYFI